VAIGLGSNLGDRVQNIIDARNFLLAYPGCAMLHSSALYYSSPVGYLEQPAFINCVVLLDVEGSLPALLRHAQAWEEQMGRERVSGNRNAPRIIDLDILLAENEASNIDSLQVPHPRLAERLFVLLPLLELWPDASLPDGKSVASLLSNGQQSGAFAGQQIHRLG